MYLNTMRSAYAVCAEVARHAGRKVIPFPEVPADFLQERTVHASDGKRTMLRTIWHTIDIRKMSPEQGARRTWPADGAPD